jgi:hypothetical protein
MCPLISEGLDGSKYFGYYKISSINTISTLSSIQDHANVIHITTADPSTVSLEQVDEFEKLRSINLPYKLIIEWGGLRLDFKGQNNCQYNKCFVYEEDRFQSILNSVIKNIAIPYKGKIAAFYIADEPETNPPTIEALNRAIQEIRKRPELDEIPLMINFDNVWERYTGAPFILPIGLDWASVTPDFGDYCYNGLCELEKYQILLDSMEEYNSKSSHKMKLMIIGDAWSRSKDVENNVLSVTGENHLRKVNELYDLASSMAGERRIEVVGMLVFAYSTCCGGFSLEDSSNVIKNAWIEKAKTLTRLTNLPVSCKTLMNLKSSLFKSFLHRSVYEY